VYVLSRRNVGSWSCLMPLRLLLLMALSHIAPETA
jgi:hypothetical protein